MSASGNIQHAQQRSNNLAFLCRVHEFANLDARLLWIDSGPLFEPLRTCRKYEEV